ncbi:MAG: type II secretion system F family protein [Coriobacteriales bacterium]|nr:type II secretion system F family protein [Coriobacteriales bacterium]
MAKTNEQNIDDASSWSAVDGLGFDAKFATTLSEDGKESRLSTNTPQPKGLLSRPRSCLGAIRDFDLGIILKMRDRQRTRQLSKSYGAELPRMLEVISLGMRSGLAFDQSFALYVRRFNTPLAVLCKEPFEVWEKGLMLREQGLQELAQKIDNPIFTRFVASTIRALNYGAPLTKLLLELACEARKAYRMEQQELVAKAPVKMLLPTGALILPAMLLLVIGPILMEVLERMV